MKQYENGCSFGRSDLSVVHLLFAILSVLHVLHVFRMRLNARLLQRVLVTRASFHTQRCAVVATTSSHNDDGRRNEQNRWGCAAAASTVSTALVVLCKSSLIDDKEHRKYGVHVCCLLV
jgi:hypothetical protein